MRTNRLPPKGCRLADVIKGYLPESDWNKGASADDPNHEKRIAEYRRNYQQGRDIFTGKRLERPAKLDLVDDPTSPPIAETQRSLFTHPDIIPSESEALFGLMHSTAF